MIKFLPEVEDYLEDLIEILYQKEYFGFEESSYEYVLRIVNYVLENIETIKAKITPEDLIHRGSFYITYQSSKRTTWYIFYDREDLNFLIRYISNNHLKESAFLELNS
jgi:hypothetical protein